MLSAVVTALLLVVMLFIVTNLLVSAWRAQSHRKRIILSQQASQPTHPLDRYTIAMLQGRDGGSLGIEQRAHQPSFLLSASWYTRHRTLVSLCFFVMVLLTLFLQDGLTEGTLRTLSRGIGVTLLNTSQTSVSNLQTAGHSAPTLPMTASARLQRIDSAARSQYHTDYQWQVWSYSSCSGIAMEMVMNAYGRHLIAADVLQEEQKLGVWDVNLGLLRDEGIAMTASYYGFDTSANHTRALQDLISISNKGAPIIVSLRDNYNFPGGHFFVVRGGDNQYLYIADSSRANFQRISYSMFLAMWQGFSAVLTPR